MPELPNAPSRRQCLGKLGDGDRLPRAAQQQIQLNEAVCETPAQAPPSPHSEIRGSRIPDWEGSTLPKSGISKNGCRLSLYEPSTPPATPPMQNFKIPCRGNSGSNTHGHRDSADNFGPRRVLSAEHSGLRRASQSIGGERTRSASPAWSRGSAMKIDAPPAFRPSPMQACLTSRCTRLRTMEKPRRTKGKVFKDLHSAEGKFVMPNACSADKACMLDEAGQLATVGVGLTAGVLNGSMGVVGLPVVLFYFWSPIGVVAGRASIITYFVRTDSVGAAMFAAQGPIDAGILWQTTVFLPILVAGVVARNRGFVETGPESFKRVALFVLMALLVLLGVRAARPA